MDFPRKKEFQKISDIKNRNSKNESSVLDSKKVNLMIQEKIKF